MGILCLKIHKSNITKHCICIFVVWSFACVCIIFSETQPGISWYKNLNYFDHTLISLPGSVAMPSFQSIAFMMSNSAPWERPSLGGVSVIPTPLIAVHCKDSNQLLRDSRVHQQRADAKGRKTASTPWSSILNNGLCLRTTSGRAYVCGFF